MLRIGSLAAFLIAFAGAAFAQDDADKLKDRILEEVRERIRAEHRRILDRIGKIIEKELGAAEEKKKLEAKKREPKKPVPNRSAGSPWDKKIRDLKRKLKKMQLQQMDLANQIRRLQRFKEDNSIIAELKKDPINPDAEEVQEMFDAALEDHRQKNFKKSIHEFKKIFYSFMQAPIGNTSAYNIACGYALAGDKARALDWLELSVEQGFNEFDHIRQDTDLDSLRTELRYKRLLADR